MGNKVKKIFMRRRVPRLPDAYQEVDYIQTSGTQRINTGLYAGNNIQTETKISVETTELNHPIFGGSNGGGNYYHCTPYNNKWYVGINNSESNGGTYSNTIGTIYTIVFNNTNSYLNVDSSDVVSVSGTQGQSGTTLQIAGRYNGSTWYYGIYKYYYFKMYDKTAGKYVRDFVPCYRKSDSVIGMYDLVNDQFYTNAGSGTFTKGTDSSTLVYKEFQVWPDDQWQLRDETDMANSTTGSSGVIASTNGKFIRPSYSFGGGNGAYSKGTIDGYDVLVASSSHGNVHIGLSDANYTDLMSHKKVKIVRDYFNLGANQSNYTNGIWFGGNESLTDTSSSSTITVGSNWSGMSFSYSTGYSMEQVIKTSDMSCTTTITNLSNQAKSTFTYTKVFSRETNSTYIINGGGNRFIWMNDDYGGGPVRAGNIHVYYTD